MKDLVRKVWYFDIQDKRLPVIVSYVLWGYFYPVQNDTEHILSIEGLEESLYDDTEDVVVINQKWENNFNEYVNNPMNYICSNPNSRKEFMKRKQKPTLLEGFQEFKDWLYANGIKNDDDNFVVSMWW